MKLYELDQELNETMHMGRFDLSSVLPKLDISDCIHEGHLDGFEWYSFQKNDYVYYLSFSHVIQTFICCAKHVYINGKEYIELLGAQTDKDYLGNQYLTRLMFFLKTHKHKSLLVGDVISTATLEIIKKANNTGRFKIKWINLEDYTEYMFDNQTIYDYMALDRITKFRIMIEHSAPYTPRYFDKNNIKSYAILFE